MECEGDEWGVRLMCGVFGLFVECEVNVWSVRVICGV